MNLAILPSAFFPSLGGVEELSRQLAMELARRGHNVIIVTNRWPRDLPPYEVIDGLPVYRLALRVPEGSRYATLNYQLSHRFVQKQMASILRKHKIEMLHVQCVSVNAFYALRASRKLGLPLVVTLQGELTMDAGQIFQRSDFAKGMLREVLAEADLITGCSQKTIADAEEFFGEFFGTRSRAIFNAARIADFQNAPPRNHARPYIAAMGRLVPQKGFDILLRAFAVLHGAGVTSHDLIIAGDGDEMPALKSLAKELAIESHVYFPGKADRATAASLLNSAALFVLPSRADEGLPVVCAEALAAGRAVVATRSGGAPEVIIDGQNGLIVDKNDVNQLAGAIQKVLGDDLLRRTFEQSAKARAQMFDWSTITTQYQDAYHAAAKLKAQHYVPVTS